MKNKILLSICIPTYNREAYLVEAIESIVLQIDEGLRERVEIVISDNFSNDETQNVVKGYAKKNKSIKYFRNERNIGMAKNLVEVGKHAKGEYIWFLSDDDVQNKGGIKQIVKLIGKYFPDVIFCNLDECSRDMKKVITRNSMNIEEDIYLHGRRELYKFLNTKFFYNIDWYTTYYSNLILKKSVYKESARLSKIFSTKLDLFPQSLGIYYSKNDYDIYICADRLVKYRNSNLSWGPKEKKEFLRFTSRLYDNHYGNIKRINSDVLLLSFKVRLLIKKFIKHVRVDFLLPVFNY